MQCQSYRRKRKDVQEGKKSSAEKGEGKENEGQLEFIFRINKFKKE